MKSKNANRAGRMSAESMKNLADVIRHESDMADGEDETESDTDETGSTATTNNACKKNNAEKEEKNNPDERLKAENDADEEAETENNAGETETSENTPYHNLAKYRMVPASDDNGIVSSSRS